jgi:hypothetical protein
MRIATKLNLTYYPEIHKKYQKKIHTVLQKIGTSKKTKALHHITDIIYISFDVNNMLYQDTLEYGEFVPKNDMHKLDGLIINIKYLLNESDRETTKEALSDFIEAKSELKIVKTRITPTTETQLKRLKETIEKSLETIIENIDYFQLVDIAYFMYLSKLCEIGLATKGKNKLFEATRQTFGDMIEGIFIANEARLDELQKSQASILIDYMFVMNFTNQSPQTTLTKLNKMYGNDKLEFLIDIKPSQYKEFKNLGTMFSKAKLLNISDNMFMQELGKFAGLDIQKAFNSELELLIGFIISANYKSELFGAYKKLKDPAPIDRLENLVLNYKRELKKKDISLNK